MSGGVHCLSVTLLVVTGSNGTFTSAVVREALRPALDAWQVLAVDEFHSESLRVSAWG